MQDTPHGMGVGTHFVAVLLLPSVLTEHRLTPDPHVKKKESDTKEGLSLYRKPRPSISPPAASADTSLVGHMAASSGK